MNDPLKAKIVRRLDSLSDEMGRQLLDYVEFLESRHNRTRRSPSAARRITEGLEERTGQIGDLAARGAAGLLDAAGRVMSGLAAASRTVAEELESRTTETAASEDGAAAPPTADAGEGAGTAGKPGREGGSGKRRRRRHA